MKKILSLLLAMLMVIGMFPMTALAIENPASGVEFIITANGEEIEAVYDGEEYSNIAYMVVPKYIATLPADSDSFTISYESGLFLASLADMNPICMGAPSCTVEVSGNNSYMVGCPNTGFSFHLYIEIPGANRRVTLSSGTGYTVIGEKEIANGEDYSFSVELMENYQAGENFAVKVNGEIIGTEPGNYTIENVTENIDIKVVGVEPIKAEEVTVYFSVEEGDHFVEQGGKIWALEEVTIPYFDLANYGMEYLYFNPDCYSEGGNYAPQVPGTKETAENNVTMLHMLIWLTEIYWHEIDEDDAGKGFLANEGNWEGFKIKGSPIAGSAFFLMWNFGYNFNYYVNYEYPLGAPGWGSSCDQIRLFDGDVVTIRYNDNSGKVGTYHHFGEEGLVSKTVKKGENETFELELFRTGQDSSKYTTPIFNAGEGHNVYLMAEDNMYTSPKEGTLMGTTNAEGKVTIDTKDVKPGIYYLVSGSMSPAVMLLEVICEHDWKDATCKEPKTCSVCGETEGKELGHSFGEWEVVKEASYTEEGIKKRVCKNDQSHFETETIEKLIPTATEKTEGPNGKSYYVDIKNGVLEPTSDAVKAEYPTASAIVEAFEEKIEECDLDTEKGGFAIFEATIGYFDNAGKFVPASEEFFADGRTLKIKLPIPNGADKNDKFVIYHLNSETGIIDEYSTAKTGFYGIEVINEDLVIEVNSLSPFAIAYESVANNNPRPSEPVEKDVITIVVPLDKAEESNPNTGAPVLCSFDLTAAGVVVLAATAAVLEIKRKK